MLKRKAHTMYFKLHIKSKTNSIEKLTISPEVEKCVCDWVMSIGRNKVSFKEKE